jgi:hypothetical protein
MKAGLVRTGLLVTATVASLILSDLRPELSLGNPAQPRSAAP